MPRDEAGEFKALPYREAPAFMEQLGLADGIAARCLEFSVLTACRTQESLLSTWSEFDLDAAVWIVPKEPTKAMQVADPASKPLESWLSEARAGNPGIRIQMLAAEVAKQEASKYGRRASATVEEGTRSREREGPPPSSAYVGQGVQSMRTKTTPYDVAEHLRTPEEMAAYLDAWLEEAQDDAAGIAGALGNSAKAKGMTQVAKDAGLSRESLYRALSADDNPSFATVLKVAKALGVKLRAEVALRRVFPMWPNPLHGSTLKVHGDRERSLDSALSRTTAMRRRRRRLFAAMGCPPRSPRVRPLETGCCRSDRTTNVSGDRYLTFIVVRGGCPLHLWKPSSIGPAFTDLRRSSVSDCSHWRRTAPADPLLTCAEPG